MSQGDPGWGWEGSLFRDWVYGPSHLWSDDHGCDNASPSSAHPEPHWRSWSTHICVRGQAVTSSPSSPQCVSNTSQTFACLSKEKQRKENGECSRPGQIQNVMERKAREVYYRIVTNCRNENYSNLLIFIYAVLFVYVNIFFSSLHFDLIYKLLENQLS